MTEGRRSQVVLLDERRLDILIKPKLYACELLDMVASHFNLKEKEYFGLAFIEDTGHYAWLQLDKRVLEHELPKHSGILTLHFMVKYFVESITQLRDSSTVAAFYLQAKSLVFKGIIEVDSETAVQLAALVLQATHGDFVDEQTSKSHLKKIPVLSASVLKDHSSISQCEEKVITHYKSLNGQSKGAAIVNYVSIVESLPTYGTHFYEVKDKGGSVLTLGLSFKGISLYHKDRKASKKVFLWKQLDNIYYRDRKFSIEVHEARRVVHTLSSFNLYEDAIEEPIEECDDLSDAISHPTTQVSVSRRTLAPGNVTVYVWFAASIFLTKCIWSMVVSQHQFYLDRRHRKSYTGVARSLGQIAADLSCSVQSLSSASSFSNLSRSTSSNSLPALKLEGDPSEDSQAAALEMLTALKARKEALEEALKRKTEELKALCLKEGEITGELPPETPLIPGEPFPHVRRRIGTSFALSDKLIVKAKSKKEEAVSKLELEYEIQSKIASAAHKLASDMNARKSVRKQRKLSYQQSINKLRDIEEKLSALKRIMEMTHKKARRPSDDDPSDDSVSHSTDDSDVFQETAINLAEYLNSEESNNQQISRVLVHSSKSSSPAPTNSSSLSLLPFVGPASSSAPPSPSKHRQRHRSLQNEVQPISWLPASVESSVPLHYMNSPRYSGSTCSEYDNISCSSGSLKVPYGNRFEATLDMEGTNLYNVVQQRTSLAFINSQDNLLVLPSTESSTFSADTHSSNDQENSNFHIPDSFRNSTTSPISQTSVNELSIGNSRSAQDYLHYHIPSKHSLENLDYSFSSSVIEHCSNSESLSHLHSSEPNLKVHADTFKPVEFHVNSCTTPPVINSSENVNSCCYSTQSVNFQPQFSRTWGSTCPPQKMKPKEWVETSLDSPLPQRKTKFVCNDTDCLDGESPPQSEIVSSFVDIQDSAPQQATIQEISLPLSPSTPSFAYPAGFEVNVVAVGHFQPYWEETKPYELSDFYKYSTKHRRQSVKNSCDSDISPNSTVWTQLPYNPLHASTSIPEVGESMWQKNKEQKCNSDSTPAPLYSEGAMEDNVQLVISSNEGAAEDSFSLSESHLSLADVFHEEMLAWYEDQGGVKKATLV